MRFSLIALVELFLIISSSGQNLRGEKNTKNLSSKQIKDEVESLLSSKEIKANADENDDGSEEKNRLDKIRDKIKYLEDLLSTETKDKTEEEFSEERDFSGNKLEDTIVEDQDETDYEEGNSKFEASSFSDEKSLFDKFSGNDATAMNIPNDVVLLDDRLVVRQYAGAFLEKMLEELQAGNEKGVEHVFRNLALFLSPPVTALDGGGVPLARLRKNIPPKVVERFDGLSLNGARLADVILSRIPYQGKSAYDKDRVLVASQEFPNSPSKQVDAMFASIWTTTPLEDFQTVCA